MNCFGDIVLCAVITVIIPATLQADYRISGKAWDTDQGMKLEIKLINIHEPLLAREVNLENQLTESGKFKASRCGDFDWYYQYQRKVPTGIWTEFSLWRPMIRTNEVCTSGVIPVEGPYRWQMMEAGGYTSDLVEIQ